MAPRKSHEKDHKPMTPNKSTASTGTGVVKRRYRKVRFHEDGLLNVERKNGKYFKMAQQNQRQSPLLCLPAELRNKIFSYALGGKTFEIVRREYTPRKLENVTKHKHVLNLLQVCRQIYAETTLLPFSTNIFSVSYPYQLGKWAESLHPARAQSITWVQVNFPSISPFLRLTTAYVFRHGDLPSSSGMRDRGDVALSSVFLEGYSPACREKRRKVIEDALQESNEGIQFVWQ